MVQKRFVFNMDTQVEFLLGCGAHAQMMVQPAALGFPSVI